MLIRHTGIFVDDINKIEFILLQLDFEKIYDEYEYIDYQLCNVRKFLYSDNYILELIRSPSRARGSTFHISIEGEIPEFMKKYRIESHLPKDQTLLVDFVYINDSIYFEFVRSKNELQGLLIS